MIWAGLACGIGLALVNGAIAWITIRWTWDSRPQLFVKVFLGGMALRLVLVAAVSAILLLVTSIHPGYFVAGLGTTYILVLIAEIVAVVRRNERDSHGRNSLASPGEPKVLCCRGLEIDPVAGNSHGLRKMSDHLGNIGCHHRSLGNDRGIDIDDLPAILMQQ